MVADSKIRSSHCAGWSSVSASLLMDSQARGLYMYTRHRSNNADENKRQKRSKGRLKRHHNIQTGETLIHLRHDLDVEQYPAQTHLLLTEVHVAATYVHILHRGFAKSGLVRQEVLY